MHESHGFCDLESEYLRGSGYAHAFGSSYCRSMALHHSLWRLQYFSRICCAEGDAGRKPAATIDLLPAPQQTEQCRSGVRSHLPKCPWQKYPQQTCIKPDGEPTNQYRFHSVSIAKVKETDQRPGSENRRAA